MGKPPSPSRPLDIAPREGRIATANRIMAKGNSLEIAERPPPSIYGSNPVEASSRSRTLHESVRAIQGRNHRDPSKLLQNSYRTPTVILPRYTGGTPEVHRRYTGSTPDTGRVNPGPSPYLPACTTRPPWPNQQHSDGSSHQNEPGSGSAGTGGRERARTSNCLWNASFSRGNIAFEKRPKASLRT